MYHSISNSKKSPADQWTVSANNFMRQIRLLKSEGWTTTCVRNLYHPELLSPQTIVITFDDGYADNFEHAFRVLSACSMCATWFIVSRKIGKQSRLDIDQLRQMSASGMEIGAHTRTHARLPELDASKIDEEVRGSKKDLEDLLGLPVTSFAYPYGLFNEESIESVRRSGFKIACTTRTGWFGSEPDLLRVRRVAVFPHDDLSRFARKVAFADNDVSWSRMTRYMTSRLQDRLFISRKK